MYVDLLYLHLFYNAPGYTCIAYAYIYHTSTEVIQLQTHHFLCTTIYHCSWIWYIFSFNVVLNPDKKTIGEGGRTFCHYIFVVCFFVPKKPFNIKGTRVPGDEQIWKKVRGRKFLAIKCPVIENQRLLPWSLAVVVFFVKPSGPRDIDYKILIITLRSPTEVRRSTIK